MDVEALHKEIARFGTQMAADEAQGKLLENFVAGARSPAQAPFTRQRLLAIRRRMDGLFGL